MLSCPMTDEPAASGRLWDFDISDTVKTDALTYTLTNVSAED